jgi:CRISPR-associated protein Csd2
MSTRGLYIFKHESELGNAPAHALFDRIKTRLKDGVTVPRNFADYEVTMNESEMPPGVTLLRKV